VHPSRIVSLVPSLTETLFDYGVGDRLVGRTRYCTEPSTVIQRVEAIGGTKNPDIERIVELEPDLVIANKEENRLEDYQRLRDAGLEVWVCHPRTVGEAACMFSELGRVVGATERGDELADRTRRAVDAVRGGALLCGDRAARVFCPIWRNPWMTFGADTYICDVLRTVGLVNIFAEDGLGDFFEVDLAQARDRGPDLVLLPDEPYAFSLEHAEELCEFGFSCSVAPIDGRDLSWYGPRLPVALGRLRTLCSHILSTSGV